MNITGLIKWRWELFLICIATTIVLVVAFGLGFAGMIQTMPFTGGDARGYLEAGQYLGLHGKIHYFRTWGYPVFTSIPAILGLSLESTRVFLVVLNFLFWEISGLFIFWWIQRCVGKILPAAIMAVIFWLSPGIWVLNFTTLSEPLFILCVIYAFYRLDGFFRNGNSKDVVAFYIVFIISASVRPINLYPAIFALFLLLVFCLAKKAPFKLLLIPGVAFIASVTLPMCAMYFTYGNFTYTYNSKYLLYHYIGSRAESIPHSSQNVMYDSFERVVKNLDAREKLPDGSINWRARNSFYEEQNASIFKRKKKELLVALWLNFKDNVMSESILHYSMERRYANDKSNKTFLYKLFSSLSRWQNLILTLLLFCMSIVVLWRIVVMRRYSGSRDNILLALIAQQMALIGLASLSFWQGDRFAVVVYPFVFVMLSVLVCNFLSSQKRPQQSST